MTIHQLQQKYKNIEIDLLLEHTLKKSREFLYTSPEFNISARQYNNTAKLIKRRLKGEPIAYLLGYKYFYGLKFKVNKHVLIPRPETEWLIDKAREVLNKKTSRTLDTRHSPLSILDMGTGSGCIAVSVACGVKAMMPIAPRNGHHYSAEVTASDISKPALEVAKANAKAHHANVKFIQSNLFSKIPGKFDIVIANLPYVPQGMYELLYHNLKYEPKVAITDGGEVWEIYERFFTELPKHLKPGGIALLEIDDGAKSTMQKMIKQLLPAFKAIFHKDLGGLWRYIELSRHTAKN